MERREKKRLNKAIKKRCGFRFVSLLLIIFFSFSASVFGATLAEYRKKIQDAVFWVDDLYYIDDEELTPSERAKHEKEIMTELRRSLSKTENIEWQGGKVETDNGWFFEKLDEYEKEKNPEKRQTILLGISERLTSIEQKINELENPPAANRSKDEDKRKLNEILSREEYRKPEQKEESLIQRIIRKIQEWFRRKAPDAPQMPESAKSGFGAISQILQYLLYALIFAAIGFLIYRFLPFVSNKIKRREKREKKERIILGERIAANESAENLFSEAEKLAREGNMRGAIRKGYIALLCELSDRKIIGLAQHKTNRDYLRDVRKNQNLHQNMNDLTDTYERHWYGFDEADESDWNEFRQGYKKAVNG